MTFSSAVRVLTPKELRRDCPVKWHPGIPQDGLSFGVADIDFEGPAGINEFIGSRLGDEFAFYQDQTGLKSSKTAAINYLAGKGIPVQEKNIQITPGTMLGIYAAMKYASRRDGEVLCVGPLYEPIHRHATDTGNSISWVPIDFHNNNIDHDLLTESINNHTKLIAINNPSNPVGYLFNESDLQLLADLCLDYDIICFSDELYEPLTFGIEQKSLASIPHMHDRTILLYGFSKAYGLAGYRSGFMFLGNLIEDEIKKIIEAQLVSPSPFASIVCEYALTHPNMRSWQEEFNRIIDSNLKWGAQFFSEAGYECHIPESCFFLFPNLKIDDILFTENLLKNKGIQVVEGSKFGPMGRNHIRINCATSRERLEVGLQKIIDELRSFSG